MTTGEKKSKLIINDELSEKEKKEKIKMLEELKIQLETKNGNRILLERANRIYSELSNNKIRNYISVYLQDYEKILKTGNTIDIRKIGEAFSSFLDRIDPELNDTSIEEILQDIKDKGEDTEFENEDDDMEFWN